MRRPESKLLRISFSDVPQPCLPFRTIRRPQSQSGIWTRAPRLPICVILHGWYRRSVDEPFAKWHQHARVVRVERFNGLAPERLRRTRAGYEHPLVLTLDNCPCTGRAASSWQTLAALDAAEPV